MTKIKIIRYDGDPSSIMKCLSRFLPDGIKQLDLYTIETLTIDEKNPLLLHLLEKAIDFERRL